MKVVYRIWLGMAATAAVGSAALVAPAAPGRAVTVQKLAECRKVADNTARLACYDAVAAEIDQAEAKGDIVVVDREQARGVRRQAFGFHMPAITLFERGEKPEEVNTVTGAVAAARVNGAGKWVVRLEDGAVWSQIDSNEVPFPPKPGMPVKIRKASMGSYMMTVGKVSFRAHREE
jgi:hypothetical protein